MARKKPYTVTLGIVDILLSLFTGGFWLLIVLVRELYMRS